MDQTQITSAKIRCPSCKKFEPTTSISISFTCPICRLWWVSSDTRESILESAITDNSKTRFLFREIRPVRTPIFLILGTACVAALITTVGNAMERPTELEVWVFLLLGIFLGFCGMHALREGILSVLVAIHPSRLEANGKLCRVRFYNTWDKSKWRDAFRQSAVEFSFADLQGCSISAGQSGWEHDTNLFIRHSSGLHLGTGWSGSRKSAIRVGGELQSWLTSQDKSR